MFINALIITIVCSIFLYFYWFHKRVLFFQQNCIPFIKPNYFFGNIAEFVLKKKSLNEIYQEIYRKFEHHKIVGVFHFYRHVYLIRDLEILKAILVKDFDSFPDRGISQNLNNEPLAENLVFMRGEKWKILRKKLAPAFCIGKIKMMFSLIKVCAENLSQVIEQIPANEDTEFKNLSDSYTNDVISTCAFGLEINTLQNPESEFRKITNEISKFRIQFFLRWLISMPPIIINLFKMYMFDKKFETFFFPLIKKTIKYREENNIIRHDFLDSLIDLKKKSNVAKTNTNQFQDKIDDKYLEKCPADVTNNTIEKDIEITDELLLAQAFVFYIGGLQTSSSTLSFLLLELALNPDIQNKARKEITAVLEKNGNELNYEVMREMTYIEMIVLEILRKHPPTGLTMRRSATNYQFPGTDIKVKENDLIIIPILGLHRDKMYYEKPDEFFPEHFTEEAKARRPYFTYLPFGEGPRMCIANVFAEMGIKIALIMIIKNFSFRVSPKTKLPIKYSLFNKIVNVEGGVWLKFKKISIGIKT